MFGRNHEPTTYSACARFLRLLDAPALAGSLPEQAQRSRDGQRAFACVIGPRSPRGENASCAGP
jgi:hypothetical protein